MIMSILGFRNVNQNNFGMFSNSDLLSWSLSFLEFQSKILPFFLSFFFLCFFLKATGRLRTFMPKHNVWVLYRSIAQRFFSGSTCFSFQKRICSETEIMIIMFLTWKEKRIGKLNRVNFALSFFQFHFFSRDTRIELTIKLFYFSSNFII